MATLKREIKYSLEVTEDEIRQIISALSLYAGQPGQDRDSLAYSMLASFTDMLKTIERYEDAITKVTDPDPETEPEPPIPAVVEAPESVEGESDAPEGLPEAEAPESTPVLPTAPLVPSTLIDSSQFALPPSISPSGPAPKAPKKSRKKAKKGAKSG